MNYNIQLITDFIEDLISLDKEFVSIFDSAEQDINSHKASIASKWEKKQKERDSKIKGYISTNVSIMDNSQNSLYSVTDKDIASKGDIYSKLLKTNISLAMVRSVLSNLKDISFDKSDSKKSDSLDKNYENLPIEQLLSEIEQLSVSKQGNPSGYEHSTLLKLNIMCKCALRRLEDDINLLRKELVNNMSTLHRDYDQVWQNSHKNISDNWTSTMSYLNDMFSEFSLLSNDNIKSNRKVNNDVLETKKKRLNNISVEFCKKHSPKEYAEEYARIMAFEPSFENYICAAQLPNKVYTNTLEYDVSSLGLCTYTKLFLEKYYYFMYRNNNIVIPNCTEFGSEFNSVFKYNDVSREQVVRDACELGERLFMMLPPGKVNFTFADPVRLGESFATFTRLVDVDNRTSEVINGKIWSSPADIEDKLSIMTNHISNVTQRCLQGKYNNIFEYNKVAEQNAEAYQVVMLMDYPAGFSEHSLKLLEQIVTSGPKCGVFTIIYNNSTQHDKTSERLYPLINSIESNCQTFNYSDDSKTVTCGNIKIKNQPLMWNRPTMPSSVQMDFIISTLKKGIKSAEKVVIGIDKVSNAESSNSVIEGIRIPIGVHGANEVQYLTLGVGGSHHALIAGVAGSGKSSLLHTIILKALTQYSPEELVIYLVDFKRGVEFKIYADYVLPSFKVVAIESEREFGYNILAALEREQKIRADQFKKNHVDKIEEYKELGKKMPRILVIMDEFHELFSSANDDLAKKSAVIMERIVRQGRAFGVHMILASQSYSNITGIDKAVFDQMAVRIVLKCSKSDANLLLDNGSAEIDQISIDDPGRAVYNSEAGNKEYNSHFRVAYIDPKEHGKMLQQISDTTKEYANPQQPTRILLSNIEDNNYSIFNQFTNITADNYKNLGRLYIGEQLSISNDMPMDFTRTEYSNMLMIGTDTEKARSMFAFSILSLCINYWIANRKAPESPFIYLFNCKPLNDSYFKDTPKLLSELLPEYIKYISCAETNEINSTVSALHDSITEGNAQVDKYFFVFGYQRADELKSEVKMSQSDDIDSIFNITSNSSSKSKSSLKDMFKTIVKDGAQKGVHAIIWQDSFNALYQDDKDMMSYFAMKIAFDMTVEEYSRFVGVNDVGMISDNNAIYYNRAMDNQKFRPYQAPDEEWLNTISEKLK